MFISLKNCAAMLNDIESDRAIIGKILLEKERQKLSYSDLVRKLKRKGSHWTELFNGAVPPLADKLKQSLHAKKLDDELRKELCSVLDIDIDNQLHRIEGYRYNQRFGSQLPRGGRPSAKMQEEKSRQCEVIKENVEATDSTTIEEALLHSGEIYYEDEWIDRDTYEMLIEEAKEKELIEKILLIHEQEPAILEEFLAQFEFVDDTP
ncbi:hypothetical protein [Flintibacter sp. KGMB00164]|uniref:hypothetical protein n=1 Tax=Flintibacter sp. KGMB00164 TaxID=2610895 RepID=UPI001245B53B|nr:hypothetical protein [Flintibacter sp. KGMB00164]